MSKTGSRKRQPKSPARPAGQADPQLAPPAEEIKSLQAEREDLLARLQRVSADYVNYQKRVQRDIDQVRQFANEDLIKSLLDVLDDMDRAMQVARQNHSADDPLLAGMQMVHDKALATLGRFGLVAIEAVGRPFDPDRHTAMMQEPSEQHPPMTILRELQKGYQLKGRTIRPSAVAVSTRPEDRPADREASQDSSTDRRDGDAHV